ncbi:MAG TPA: glucose-6-phosphate isomerase [Candidatus Bathyarchaeia archaeon]|nr:glucose-6-phosphate isomerase [Candidatus Bathyarchaeia archaeon]
MASAYRRKRKHDDSLIHVDLNGVMQDMIGGEAGVSVAELEAIQPRLVDAVGHLADERKQGLRPFLDLPYEKAALEETLALADELRRDLDWFVMLAIGGSALGARAIATALAPGGGHGGPGHVGLIVADNIDPQRFVALLDGLDLRRTIFNVISKSGETAETMAQFLIVRERLLRELGAVDYAKHLLVTTEAESGSLRQIVNDEGFSSTNFPASVGGRFSVLSSVHLLPAALLDVDVTALLAGAQAMDERCKSSDLGRNPAAMLAAAHYLLDTLHGISIAVMMPYSDLLSTFAEWWCELWAESLGKRLERDGSVVAIGQTPVRAVGATDQHSQIQLYVDGPADKVVSFLRVADHGARVEVPRSYPDIGDVAYLGGLPLGELLNAEQRATELALQKHGRPTITIELPAVTPFALGQLFYLMEVTTILAAELYGVDPYNQPGIEEGKRLTFGLAGKPGFEEQKSEVEAWLQRKKPALVL